MKLYIEKHLNRMLLFNFIIFILISSMVKTKALRDISIRIKVNQLNVLSIMK